MSENNEILNDLNKIFPDLKENEVFADAHGNEFVKNKDGSIQHFVRDRDNGRKMNHAVYEEVGEWPNQEILKEELEKAEVNKIVEQVTGTRIIETTEQAKEVLTEMQDEIKRLEAMDPKERKLLQFQKAKDAFNQLTKFYNSLDRRGKRKFTAMNNPELKKSNQLKKILNRKDPKTIRAIEKKKEGE